MLPNPITDSRSRPERASTSELAHFWLSLGKTCLPSLLSLEASSSSANTYFVYVERTMGYENHVYLAKLAEQAERYEGMIRIRLFTLNLC